MSPPVGLLQRALSGAYGQDLPEIYPAEYPGAFLRGNNLMPLMQRLESGAPQVHLDIHTDDLDPEVARLERLDGKRVQKRDRGLDECPASPAAQVQPGSGAAAHDAARRTPSGSSPSSRA